MRPMRLTVRLLDEDHIAWMRGVQTLTGRAPNDIAELLLRDAIDKCLDRKARYEAEKQQRNNSQSAES